MNKINANEKMNKTNVIIVVVVTLAIHLLRICMANVINISLDEIGTLAAAAYCSGNDWSSVVMTTRYYGAGFYWLYSIFFSIISNPYCLVFVIYLSNSLCISLCGILIYRILVKYLKMKPTWYTVLIAIMPGITYVNANWNYISNDVPVYVAYWILIYLCIMAFYEKENVWKRRGCSILAALAMGYLLTVHEKSVVVWAAVIISIVLFKIIFGEFIVSPMFFSVSCCVSYVIARKIKAQAILLFWPQSETLANADALSSVTGFLFDKLMGWKIMLDVIISNFILLNEKTFGVVGIAVGFIVFWSIKSWKYIVCGKKLNFTIVNKIRYFLILVSFVSTAAMVLGLAVQWGPGIYKGYYSGIIGKSTRAYGYLRYYVAFTGPAVISVCSMLKYIVRYHKRMLWSTFGAMFLLVVYYYFCIHSYLYDRWNATSMAAFSIFPSDKIAWNIYLSLVVLIMILFILCIFKSEKMIKIYYILSFSMLVVMNIDFHNIQIPSIRCDISDAGYNLIKEIEEKEEIVNLYAEENASVYQFMLFQYTIHNDLPPENVDEAIVLSNRTWLDEHSYALGEKGFYYTQLDSNEYVYVKGERYLNLFEEMGYVLQTDTVLSGKQSYVLKEEAGSSYVIYDDSISLDKGTYKIKYKIQLMSELNRETYGYVDAMKTYGGYMNRKEIDTISLDENGTGTIEIIISSDKTIEEVVFRYFAYEGVEMEVFPVSIKKISEKYDVGADAISTALGIADVINFYNMEYGKYDVYIINDGSRGEQISLELMETLVNQNNIKCIELEEIERDHMNENSYIVSFHPYAETLSWDNGYCSLAIFDGYYLYFYSENLTN